MIHEVNARIYAAKSKIYNPYHVNMRPYKEDMRPNPSDIRPPPKYILLNLKEIRQIKKSSPIKQKHQILKRLGFFFVYYELTVIHHFL